MFDERRERSQPCHAEARKCVGGSLTTEYPANGSSFRTRSKNV